MKFLWICYLVIFTLIISKRIRHREDYYEGSSYSSDKDFEKSEHDRRSRGLYKKITHNTDPNARCLDGTSPPVFLHQGSQPQNVLLYLMGGGACADSNTTQSLEACYQRSLTMFGSSNLWNDTYNAGGQGILDTNPAKNKFAGWTKIIIIYCDGSLYQGNNNNPVPYKGTNIYFRGAVNMRSHISWANSKFDLNKANKVVLAGSSAGGFGVFLWIDYLKSQVSDPSKVYGIADSGIFMDPASGVKFGMQVYSLLPFETPSFLPPASGQAAPTSTPTTSAPSFDTSTSQSYNGVNHPLSPNIGGASLTVDGLVQFMALSNADERPPNTNCINSLNGTTSDWQCLFAGYASRYLQSKLLWIQAEYDSFVIKNMLSINCIALSKVAEFTLKGCNTPNLLFLDFYRSVIMMQIYTQLQATGHSLWSIACSWHVSISDGTIFNSRRHRAPYTGDRLTAQDAIVKFVIQNGTVNSVDQYPWPSNRECAY